MAREKLVEATNLVAKQGLIAHGRGEAFDYLLGEQTCPPAMRSIKAAASLIRAASSPVISVNGNVVALAAKEVAHLSEASGAKVEVNLFHRTPERVAGLTKMMSRYGPVGQPLQLLLVYLIHVILPQRMVPSFFKGA